MSEYSTEWDILRVIHGSRAYGTHTEESDTDIKGVCITPKEYFFSIYKNFEQYESKEPDTVIFEIRKFFKLALSCNPNIIETLFTAEKDIIYMDNIGQELLENAPSFLSKKAKHTFTGYAHSQLKKLKNHNKWNAKAPEDPGQISMQLGRDEIAKIDDFCNINHNVFPTPESQDHVKAHFGASKAFNWFHEKIYLLKMEEYRKYKTWVANRNPERHLVEQKFGYDTKHAYHCIRLLRMGREILEEGIVLVKRPDAEELLSIRNGAWEYDKLIEEAHKLLTYVNNLTPIKSLPDEPDMDKADELCFNLIEARLRKLK